MNKTNPLQDIEINLNLYNLYTILLQYLDKLIKNKHPKLNLITEVLDQLITLREKKIDDKELKEQFNIIHSKAYSNLTEIYDYDKSVEELNGELILDKEQKELEDIAVSN
jgi:hypothetical protein